MHVRGPDAFESYYTEIFPDRWQQIREAILADNDHRSVPLQTASSAPYFMDAASILTAQALGPCEDHAVLDMCAAPGGKTLVLAATLGKHGSLVANERSASRRSRLRKVIHEHVEESVAQQIRVTSHDARRWGLYETDAYDRILADVPCSSEAHLLRGKGDLSQWTARRSTRIAVDQYTILRAALQAVRPGGRVLYATCALSPAENESVVRKALKKASAVHTTRLLPPDTAAVEFAAKHAIQLEERDPGYQILPDRSRGTGPIYFCIIQKAP